jgi:hypothetical protein
VATGLAQIDALLLSVILGAGMFACWGLGVWLGRREPAGEVGVGFKFDDASIGLLALLLGFTFSMALNKHDARRRALVADSNAIGDFYTCASLLKDPLRSELQREIRSYAQFRLDFTRGMDNRARVEAGIKSINAAHSRMTTLVGQALDTGTPVATPLTNTLNEVTSNTASRLAAARDRLPETVLYLLFAASLITTFLVGRQQGKARSYHMVGALCYMGLAALVIYVILDLNQPRSGTIQISQEPMERLIQSMEP